MGYRLISIKAQTDYSDDEIRNLIGSELHIHEFTFSIEGKSLDARRKSDIHWLLRIGVSSPEIKGGEEILSPEIEIPQEKRNKKVVIVGSGPAGFFAALFLQKSGFSTVILERGRDVSERAKGIDTFEKHGKFDPLANYAFGEGGAGTFSDGKLTSRSKHINSERQFILNSYIRAGAPAEIAYMTHPHLGTDNLKIIVKNLRDEYLSIFVRTRILQRIILSLHPDILLMRPTVCLSEGEWLSGLRTSQLEAGWSIRRRSLIWHNGGDPAFPA